MAARKEAAVERVVALRYWRAGDARVVVEAWRRSGETLTGFGRRYGLQGRRLSRWARDLEGAGAEAGVRFHPVRLVQLEERRDPRPDAPLEVVLGEGRSVRVPPGFAAEDLERVLRVLGASAPC
ncbi:MAG: hypothetical protein Q8N53_23715 [Longimicrobiales bacterium]|nr:hypothetical protein [Longimicrobiales bacterium]